MVSIAPLHGVPSARTMPPAAGHKHNRDDDSSSFTAASTSKKRVRFASDAGKKGPLDTDDEKTPSDSDSSKQSRTSARTMFKKFVVNALDERAAVCSCAFDIALYDICSSLD
jgi:hypothetical protein